MDQVTHGVHRVGDAQDDCFGRVLEHVVHYGFYNLGVNTDKFFASHTGFAGNTAGDDYHVGAFGGCVVVGDAAQTGVETQDAGGLHDIHGFAFGYALFDVEEYDLVGYLVGYKYVGTCGTYIAGADDCYF